jgi:hypothetical protein
MLQNLTILKYFHYLHAHTKQWRGRYEENYSFVFQFRKHGKTASLHYRLRESKYKKELCKILNQN